MAGTKDWFVYTADDGTKYSMLISTYYGTSPALGFGPPDPSIPEVPQGLRPRHINVVNLKDGRRRQIPCGSRGASVYTLHDLELPGPGGGTATWTISSTYGESRRRS